MAESNASRPLALVTGASRGIGYELARQLATRGYDLAIVADSELVDRVAPELRLLGCDVIAIQQDLSKLDGIHATVAALAAIGRPIEVAALNAGVGVGGAFLDTPLEDELAMVDLNVGSTVALAKHVLRDMVARGSGRLLITSSVAATSPNPFLAVYGATKSFVQSFADAVRFELSDAGVEGVTITTLLPGPTDTNFFDRADMLDTKVGAGDKDDPATVAEQALDALMDGDARVVGGSVRNKAQVAMNKFVSDDMAASKEADYARPGSAND